jgi:hypothetical protein
MVISNFNDILNMPVEDMPTRKPFPPGTYECVVNGHYSQKDMETAQGAASKIHFPLKALNAMPDVDRTALQEMGGINEPFPDYQVWLGYNDEDAKKNAGGALEFVEACGQPVAKVNFKTALESVINCRVMCVIKHATTKNNRIVANIARVYKVS